MRKGKLSVVVLIMLIGLSRGQAQETNQTNPGGYLGIFVTPAEGDQRGVVVREVFPDGPAAKAGVRAGDRVVKIADQDVTGVKAFMQTIAATKAGGTLTLKVVRGDKEQDITVTLGQRRQPLETFLERVPGFPGGKQFAFLGVQTQPLTADLRKRLAIGATGGAVVVEVVPNSPAAQAGLKSDDVITSINDREIQDPARLREVIQEVGPGKEAALHVLRGKDNLTLKATLRDGAIGQFLTPGNERFPMLDVESMFDAMRRVRELERRVAELEQRLRTLEKK